MAGSWSWQGLNPNTPLPSLIGALNKQLKLLEPVTKAALAAGSILSGGTIGPTTNLGNGTVAAYAARAGAGVFMDVWEEAPAAPVWLTRSGTLSGSSIVNAGRTGGKALRLPAAVRLAFGFPTSIPFDASKVYRLRGRARAAANPSSGSCTVSFGLEQLGADGVTSYGVANVAASASAINVAGGWVDFTGFFRGWGVVAAPATNPASPTPLDPSTRYLAPSIAVGSTGTAGVVDVDYVAIDVFDEDAFARLYHTLGSTPGTLQGGVVDTASVQNGAITPALMTVGFLSAISANIGTITAGVINSASGTTINLNATGVSAVLSHARLGLYADGTAIFAGSLNAATGTFAGSLSAATGTFAGSLSAATGTFAGSLSAATGTFNGTLSAASITSGTIAAARITSTSIGAALGSFASLAAMNATLGTVTTGRVQNAANTSYLDLSGGSTVLQLPGLTVTTTTATFSGSLSAATGTFSGTLSAAGGTFAGTVSGSNFTATTASFSGSVAVTSTLQANGLRVDSTVGNPWGYTISDVGGGTVRFAPSTGQGTQFTGKFGAFGASPTTQPTVTGSRGANAALTSLLSALATLGWVIDSSSP